MKPQSDRLIVRHHERFRCQAPVRLVIHPLNAEAVVLSKVARSSDGSVAAALEDCSLGGLGVRSRVFIPRGCRLMVVTGGDEEDSGCPHGEHVVRVQRITMIGREPTYLLGTLLVSDDSDGDAAAEQADQLRRLIEYARSRPALGGAA